ncbi:MAG: gamma-glutamylcyclotransferase family protein [Oceanospirillaceae bacterium]
MQQHSQESQTRHYIFGYGSLINSISRTVTGETGVAVAVKISGFVRYWSRISEDFGMSSVVVVPEQGQACNGVLVEVPESELPSFDLRERGYQRVLVDAYQVEFYSQAMDLKSQANTQVKVWLYQSQEVVSPCENHPVVFSYLDVIIAGCLEYSPQFCDDFMQLTQGWKHAMLNDRHNPRYPRVQKELDTQLLNKYIQKQAPISEQQIAIGY